MDDNYYLVQPYIRGIEQGEVSYVFINGKFKYAVTRYPGVFTDQKKIEIISFEKIDKNIILYGSKIHSYFNNSLCYFRLDLVYNNNIPTIMEIETIDPDLFVRNISDINFRNEVIDSLSSSIIEKLSNR